MNITISESLGFPPLTILHLDGKLDGTNFESLSEAALKVYAAGARDLILDLSQLTYISSAGIAALHRVALVFRGEAHPDQDEGWAAYRAIDRDRGRGVQAHVKLSGLTEEVRYTLDLTGFSALFEIYGELRQAVDSFHQPARVMESSLP
jgi:anti-anti-sigma regulatory factor